MHSFHPHWRYPNLTLLVLSLIATYFLLRNGNLHNVINSLGELGYLGVFVTGLFFVSTFTVAPAAAVLFTFAQDFNPLVVALIGGLGAMVGDYVAMRFIRDRLFNELNPFLRALHLYHPVNILHSKYFAWFGPVVGAAIIASPFPDETGLILLGASKISPIRLLIITYLLNAIGIFLIALAAN